MHYTVSQHIADEDIDPVNSSGQGTSYENPFTTGKTFAPNQFYLVPISLGTVPNLANVTAGCGITPSEEDNLLDATQRHLSADWNTDDWYAPFVASTSGEHPVDYPDHTDPNAAGAVIVRYYQGVDTCTGLAFSNLTCGVLSSATNPVYFGLRDSVTGCPVALAPLLKSNFIYTGTGAGQLSPFSTNYDPTQATNSTTWLDATSETNHVTYANSIPDSCYSDGSLAVHSQTVNYPGNAVAWERSPEYLVLPAPDDAYIGGAIPYKALSELSSGTCPPNGTAGPCVLLLQFELPAMPNTPCAAPYTSCNLSGTEQLRYYSLTFGYLNEAGAQSYVSNPDGLNQASPNGVSLLSLSDQAFNGSTTVNLVVNFEPNNSAFTMWAQNGTGLYKGVSPAVISPGTPSSHYTAYQVGAYTAVDLTQVPMFSGLATNSAALEMYIRNTLPAGFAEAGQAVPYSTAQYLGNGSGIMGPYIPIVSYVPFSSLPNTPAQSLQTASTLPSNPDTNISAISPPGTVQYFPQQYWPSMPNIAVLTLQCSPPAATSPQIDFVGTQFSIPVDDRANLGTGSPIYCNDPPSQNHCSQIFAQPTQASGSASSAGWQPGVPLTIEGSGFGFLPEATLPYATSGWGPTAYLTIQDPNGNWSSPSSSCQMLILNWTPTGITVIPNVGLSQKNGYGTLTSPLAETSPFSLAGAPGCPVASKDTITVTVTNPQTGVASTPAAVVVNPFTNITSTPLN